MEQWIPSISNEIHLIHHRPNREIELEDEVRRLQAEIASLRERLDEAENKYGYESYLNNELLDVLRQHHIPFRDIIASPKRRG